MLPAHVFQEPCLPKCFWRFVLLSFCARSVGACLDTCQIDACLHTCAAGDNGQLGNGAEKDVYEPMEVQGVLAGQSVTAVSCGAELVSSSSCL